MMRRQLVMIKAHCLAAGFQVGAVVLGRTHAARAHRDAARTFVAAVRGESPVTAAAACVP